MKKTEHYQLNQWEYPDRILMSDFNADNARIDAALAAANAAVAAEAGNRQTAVNAEASARQSAINSAVQTLTAKTAVTCLGKYGGNGSQIACSLSGAEWSRYGLLLVGAYLPSSNTSAYITTSAGGANALSYSATWSAGGISPTVTGRHITILIPVLGSGSTLLHGAGIGDNCGLFACNCSAALSSISAFYLKAASGSLPIGASLGVWAVG